MIELRQVPEVRQLVRSWRQQRASVGVVMTMGALHAGHLSLVEVAVARCDKVLATIFINPIQFGPSEDYETYPHSEKRDVDLLATSGCGAVFIPPVDEIFPRGERAPQESRTLVSARGLAAVLCGPVRPGHFAGMATEVLKMLNIVAADEAYFGEKDYQQYVIIRAMAEDLFVPVRIVPCPTVREADGLALSSRNTYLTGEQRAIAPGLYRTLCAATRELRREGIGRAGAVAERATGRLLTLGFDRVDYLEFRDHELALPQPRTDLRELRVLAAARLGTARLIDNVPVGMEDGRRPGR
jgi:pantoate--beta-alanine ligase